MGVGGYPYMQADVGATDKNGSVSFWHCKLIVQMIQDRSSH